MVWRFVLYVWSGHCVGEVVIKIQRRVRLWINLCRRAKHRVRERERKRLQNTLHPFCVAHFLCFVSLICTPLIYLALLSNGEKPECPLFAEINWVLSFSSETYFFSLRADSVLCFLHSNYDLTVVFVRSGNFDLYHWFESIAAFQKNCSMIWSVTICWD